LDGHAKAEEREGKRRKGGERKKRRGGRIGRKHPFSPEINFLLQPWID